MLKKQSCPESQNQLSLWKDVVMVIIYVFAVEAFSVALSRGSIAWKIRDTSLRTDSVLLRVKVDKSKDEKKIEVFRGNWVRTILKKSITCGNEYRAMILKDSLSISKSILDINVKRLKKDRSKFRNKLSFVVFTPPMKISKSSSKTSPIECIVPSSLLRIAQV